MAESLSTTRMEAFSDGVLAVIITIMVLELKVPEGHQLTDLAVLHDNLRILLVYLLSFIQVGIYWVNHHYLLDDLETVTHGILWSNLALLFLLSLIPFGVEWIGSRGIAPVPVAIYATTFALPALAWTVLAQRIRRRTGVLPAASFGKQALSAALNFGAIGVAFLSPAIALAMIATVAVLWLIPPPRIRERTRELSASAKEHSS